MSLDGAELDIICQLQRVWGQLLHRETKTEASDATLSFARHLRDRAPDEAEAEAEARAAAGQDWNETGLVFTTRVGTAFEPPALRGHLCQGWHQAYHRPRRQAHLRHAPGCARCPPSGGYADSPPCPVDVTMNVYNEASNAKTRQALRRLGKLLDT